MNGDCDGSGNEANVHPVVKRIGRRTLAPLIRLLPPDARIALGRMLLECDPWLALEDAARRCHIEAIAARGAAGLVQSAPGDQAILRYYAERGVWAERTLTALTTFYQARGGIGHYIDIGANIGLTTIPIAQQHARLHCIAIEPDPTNFANLAANISANCPHGNVTLHQCALYMESARLQFELAVGNLGDHRLHIGRSPGERGELERQTIDVEAVPLDSLAPPEDGLPLAIKTDTQGAEPFVFAGGRQAFARADLVIAEWAPYLLARLGGNLHEVTDCLAVHFRTISIAEGEQGELVRESPAIAIERLLELAERFRSDGSRYFDLIAEK
jgi:FkbM family methyltransferase